MRLTEEQIQHFRQNGYVTGPQILSDPQIDLLKERIQDIREGRVPFSNHLPGETVEKSNAKGNLPSVKVVNIFRHDEVFAEVIKNESIAGVAHCLFEPPVRVWEDQMIYKPPLIARQSADGTGTIPSGIRSDRRSSERVGLRWTMQRSTTVACT